MSLPVPAKPQVIGKLAGGRLPPHGELLSATLEDFMGNLAGYVMAGVVLFAVRVPVTFIGIFFMYFVIFAVMIGGMIAAAAVASAFPADMTDLIMSIGSLGTGLATFVAVMAVMGGLIALLAPLVASVTRAIAAYQRGDSQLDIASAISTITQDLSGTIGVALLLVGLSLVGFLLCYLPGFIVLILGGHAAALVHHHHLRPMAAMRLSAATVMANPGWHLIYWLMIMALSMVAGLVPLLGPLFLVALSIRAYRELFGDGPEPATVQV